MNMARSTFYKGYTGFEEDSQELCVLKSGPLCPVPWADSWHLGGPPPESIHRP